LRPGGAEWELRGGARDEEPFGTKEKKMQGIIGKCKCVQAAVWLVAAGVVLLSEAELLPVAYVRPSAQVAYALHLCSVALALGGSYAALRLFAFPRVKARMALPDEEKALRAYGRCALLRSALMAAAIWSNAAVYYAANYDTTALYCLLISLTASLFCWPSLSAFKDLRSSNTPVE